MRVIKPSFEILTDYADIIKDLKIIERAGRVCYKSEDLITNESYKKFIELLLVRGHESVLEHCSLSVLVICDRGVSHEWVRHRVASYSQESTRYCNYQKDKFGSEITVILPPFLPSQGVAYVQWKHAMFEAEKRYINLLRCGITPEIARGVLPANLKTEIVITKNLREWRHFFKLRAIGTTGKPHPQMLELSIPMLKKFKEVIPSVFDDLEVK